jgi:uridine phosphorylase
LGFRPNIQEFKTSTMSEFQETELILNGDGSIFHLHLHPEQLADRIILVGDPGRVQQVSSHFSKIDCIVQNREFVTHTGWFNGKRITAISTGIGTDNIDIVVNELDALASIDLETRSRKSSGMALKLIRLGTSGALQANIPVDSYVVSAVGMGFDGLLHFYDSFSSRDTLLEKEFVDYAKWPESCNTPYAVHASPGLLSLFENIGYTGITATACGFYGPQGRALRIPLSMPMMNDILMQFKPTNGLKISNFEMETSALFGLSKLLGHEALTICAIIGNRVTKTFTKDYKPVVDNLIRQTLERFTA